MSKLKVLIGVVAVACALSIADFPTAHASEIAVNRTSSYFEQRLNPGNTTRPYAVMNSSNTLVMETRADFMAQPGTAEHEMPRFAKEALGRVAAEGKDPPSYEFHLERSSVIYGLASVANESSISSGCYNQLQHVRRSILRKEPWAMKVLDASGTKPAGFVFGQNFWLGSREACGAVQNPVGITLSKNYERFMNFAIITERAPFDMDYRVIYLRHNSPWQVEIKLMSEQIIHIGLCLPSACSAAEVQILTADYMEGALFSENDIFDIRPEFIYMKDLKLRESFYEKKTFKMICGSVIFTLLMMLAASFLRVKSIIVAEIVNEKQPPIVSPVGVRSEVADNGAEPRINPDKDVAVADNGVLEKLRRIIKCFDIQTNFEKLYTTHESTANQIPVINGLRSICAVWILAFHVLWFMYFTVNNKTFLISYGERIFFQYITSTPLLVDVFFTISGFLQTYNFMRNEKQMEIIRRNNFGQNMVQFWKLLFHRYLRLAPLYLIVIGAVDLHSAYIEDISVFHINDRYDQLCSQHWWRNVLFIQNFWDLEQLCLNWTWSLACEMQFFILATVLLFAYTKYPKVVKGVTIGMIVSTVIWSYVVGMEQKFQFSIDSVFLTGSQIYISPFVRIMPYIIGAVAAWYLVEQKLKFDLGDLKEKCAWNLSILVFFICLYSTFKRDLSPLFSISLLIFGRAVFSLAICWTIVGSATGRGSWWSRLLECRFFQQVNRLTYSIYLLNPFVIAFVFSLTNASTHADPLMLSILTTGFTVIVYFLAAIFSLAFEIPYINLSSLILKRNKVKSA